MIKSLVATLMLGCCFWNPLTAQSSEAVAMVEEVKRAVAMPIEVYRANGSCFSGELSGQIEGGFVMARQVDVDGRVEVEFQWDDVESVLFAGEAVMGEIEDLFDTGDQSGTIQVLEPLFAQRSPFFRILPDDKLCPFISLARSYLSESMATEALGVVRSLKPWVDDGACIQALEDVELLAYLLLDLDREAVELAKIRVENAHDPSGASLAWIALSLHHLNKHHYREAWLCAVHPILFDRRLESPDLADAYLVAMIAALRLNRPALAQRYWRDFGTRGLQFSQKSYQHQWVEWFLEIDWDEWSETGDRLETFADIQSTIDSQSTIDASSVPVLKIPIAHQR